MDNEKLPMSPETLERLTEFGVLAAGLAHAIRNRLNTIRFKAAHLQDTLARSARPTGASPSAPHSPGAEARPGGEPAALVKGIGDEVDWLEGMLREFLLLTRPEPPHIEPVDVAELLASVARRVEGPCRSQHIELSCDCAPAVGVAADPNQLQQVVLRLVRNAQQAMPRGGCLRLRGYPARGHAAVEVADTGPGIAEAVRAKVLQPFFSTRGEGTGLSLSICHSLLGRMNGRLEFQTEVGHGTTFVILLPRAPGGAG